MLQCVSCLGSKNIAIIKYLGRSRSLMRNQTPTLIAAATMVFALWAGGLAAAPRDPCAESLTRDIPQRAANAPGGREFAQQISSVSDDERESLIRAQLKAGNIPQFLRHLVPIRLRSPLPDQSLELVVCAAPDYLAVGSDDDFVLMPMRLSTALSTASLYGFTLPTTRIVDAINAQAAGHLAPQPLPAGPQMRSTAYSLLHNELVGAQRSALGAALGELIAGDKKDLVLTNRLRTHLDRVAIYGWHTDNGKPIQSLSTVHGWRYADYSHGARLISTRVFVDGISRSIFDVLQDNRLAPILSDEGVIGDAIGLIGTLNARAAEAMAAVVQDLIPRLAGSVENR